ncbi:MAG: molybdopterin-guanine dinucleotide biosynthesis protein B [Eggerthellaceae bacterium]|nr:molybdopterin-guanine dinucleotide biosynthesis protein B [Eggerthellaceae bacterium]
MDRPSPAVAIVGRHNSGKTTCIERLIAELVRRGHDVGSIKHHSHKGFDIDYPGKDSYRHRAAGASETIIAAPGQMARIKSLDGELECSELVRSMPNHDVVIVEGYRKSGLPTIEIMRAANASDAKVAEAFVRGAREGWPLGADFTQLSKDLAPNEKVPTGDTVAVVTDIPSAIEAAEVYGIPSFALDDTVSLANFVDDRFVRPHISVVIQAGGESRRMGRSKATVPFAGRPLICRLVERLSPAADEIVITTNEPQNLAFLQEEYPELAIRLVRDAYDFRGALPGLYTALNAASYDHVAVVACDMVFASPALVVAESTAMGAHNSDAVVPVNKHGYEPFHSVYRKSKCLPIIKETIDTGSKTAQAFFNRVNIFPFTQEMVLKVEPMGGCFINANTPEELANLEKNFVS